MVAASSLKPQIYTSLSQEPTTFRNQQEVPQEVPQEIQIESPQENSEKHPDNTFKVITCPRNKSQDAEFDGAGYPEAGLG